MAKGIKRYRRTVFLAVLACATLVWAAIEQFDIPAQEMAWLFAFSALGVLAIICAAALVMGLWLGLRRLFGRRQE